MEPDDRAELSSLAERVQAVLEAAEATAEQIRQEAEADAARIDEERERQRHAARELRHLERLADALSVQAEAVKRQCSVLRDLLPAIEEADDEYPAHPDRPPAARSAGDAAVIGDLEPEVRVRDLRGKTAPSGGEDGAQPAAGEVGRTHPHISRERVEAYRMKLAGAARTEVESYLTAAGIPEPAQVTAELFEPVARAPSAE